MPQQLNSSGSGNVQDCEGYELSKKTSGKDMYEPMKAVL